MADTFTTGVMVKMGLNSTGFKSGLRDVEGRVKTTTVAMGKVATAAGGFATALASVGVAAVALGRPLSRLASQAEETRAKFNTVFRGITREAAEMTRSMQTRLGRSQASIETWTSTIQDTLVPLGFARAEAGKLSFALAELGVDLASFNNAADAETINLLTSALVGNHEAVRRFGISITAVALDAELLNLGFQKVTKGATEQQKALARLNLMFKSSGDAIGDAERTQNSFANTMKRIQNGIADAVIVAGRAVNQFVLDVVEDFGGVENVVATAKAAFRSLAAGIATAGSLIRSVMNSIPGIHRMAGRITLNAMAGRKALSGQAKEGAEAFTSPDTASVLERMAAAMRGVGSATQTAAQAMAKFAAEASKAQTTMADRIFEVGTSGLDKAGRMDQIHQQIAGLRQSANASIAGTDFAAARAAIEQMGALVQDLNKEEGGAFSIMRRQELVALQAELNTMVEAEQNQRNLAAEAAKLMELAAQNTATATAEVAEATAETVPQVLQIAELFDEGAGSTNLMLENLRGMKAVMDSMPAAGAGVGSSNWLTQFLSQMGGGGVTGNYAQGGVAGSGGGPPAASDTVPAMLTPGEAVLSTRHTRMLAPLLGAVGVPGFASGGIAGFKQTTRAFGNALPALEQAQGRAEKIGGLVQRVLTDTSFSIADAESQMGGFSQKFASLQRMGVLDSSGNVTGSLIPGFAKGGMVGGGAGNQTINVGDVHVNYGGAGDSGSDSVGIAKAVRRAIQRGVMTQGIT